MDDAGFGFEEFSVEMGDYEVRQTGMFDRLWKIGTGGSICGLVLEHDGTVYFGSCNYNVYAVDARTGRLLWKFRTKERVINSSPVFWGGRIYVGSFDYNMYCLDAKGGKLIWKYKTEGEISSTPCLDRGKVFFGSKDRNLYCLDAVKGSLLWKFGTSEQILGTPAVHDGRLFIGSFDRNFYCMDATSGRLLWKFGTQGDVMGLTPPPVAGGAVYFASFDNFLYALDEKSGRMLWKVRTGMYGSSSSPVFHEGCLYHTPRDGTLLKMTPDGEIVWKFTKNEMLGYPLMHGGRIYVGCEDQNLYCISLDGRELWKFRTEGAILLRSAASGGRIFIPSWDCNLYAVDLGTRAVLWKFTCEGSPSYLPPANELFEVSVKLTGEGTEEETRGRYDMGNLEEGQEGGAFYKSRITYQVSTQYREKGKYQSSDDDDL